MKIFFKENPILFVLLGISLIKKTVLVSHMKKLTIDDQKEFYYSISPQNKPRLYIDIGETIIVETEDASSGHIRKLGDKRDYVKIPYSNPQSGPIFVNGAEKGDALVVEVLKISPKIGQGITRLAPWWSYFGHRESNILMSNFVESHVPDGLKIIPIKGKKVYFGKLALPYNPMIGTIGTAPELEGISTTFPGPHGGNMDLACITHGCKLYLPVKVKGALLHLGDAHAIQGDGEISSVAVEMPAEITIKIDLVKEKAIEWPRVEDNNSIMCVACTGTGRSLEETIRLAYVNLTGWMQEYGMDKWEAWELCSLSGKITLGNIWCVAAGFPKKYLNDTFLQKIR